MFVLRVTLGTVIIFIILQLYSISITTHIVYFTRQFILRLYITHSWTFTIFIFTSICSYLFINFTVQIDHYFPIYIFILHKQLNFDGNWL